MKILSGCTSGYSPKEEMVMKGTVAAPGMALAVPHLIRSPEIVVEKLAITDVSEELAHFRQAAADCHFALERLMDGMTGSVGDDTVEILDFQLLLLEDTDFIGKIEKNISEEHVNCEYAVKEASDGYITYLSELQDNDYLRERGADVSDLSMQILRRLSGVQEDTAEPDAEYIAIGVDIAPSRIAALNKSNLKGIILEKGGMTSHCVILSRSLGIPCLIETAGIIDASGTCAGMILLDAISGEAVIDPDVNRIMAYRKYISDEAAEKTGLAPYIHRETVTPDGARMKVCANITTRHEAEELIRQGGEGVGLFRSELLYMSQTGGPPSEEQQYQEYSETAKALRGKPLIIRTLDIGGDKKIDYMDIGNEDNPFLGYRAIRFCLDHPEIFKPQIAAILRTGALGNVRMMLPMITGKTEISAAKQIVGQVKEELAARGERFDADMKIGVMVETPAAIFDAGILAKEADFFSIGTNDLAQYLFAADRTNVKVAALNSYYQPTLLRAVHYVVSAAHAAGIEAHICGQAAETESLIPLWIAMEVDELSVSIPQITAVRRRVCNTKKSECTGLLNTVLLLETAEEVERALRSNRTEVSV